MFIFCHAAENEPKERAEGTEVPSGSLLSRRAGGGGIGWEVTLVRHHTVCARRSSVRSTLERLCRVLLSPVGVAVAFAEIARGRNPQTAVGRGGGRQPIEVRSACAAHLAAGFRSISLYYCKVLKFYLDKAIGVCYNTFTI